MARDFLEAREKQKAGDHQDMKVWKNTRLALTWDEAVSSDIKTETLMTGVKHTSCRKACSILRPAWMFGMTASSVW